MSGRRTIRAFPGAALAARRVLSAAVLAALCISGALASPAAAAAPQCRSAHPDLARGFSLTDRPGRLSTGTEGERRLAELHRLGMRHIRLPVLAEDVMPAYADETRIAETLAATDRALDRLDRLGYAVVVDLHPGARFGAAFPRDPTAGAAAIEAAWRRLAPLVTKARAHPVYAEVLNEPTADDATWQRIEAALVPKLRALMPTTTLIVSTGGPQRIEALLAATPVADPNTVYAIHYYDPFAFTHQGLASLGGSPIAALDRVPFPIRPQDPALPALADRLRAEGKAKAADYVLSIRDYHLDEADIARAFAAVAAWGTRHGREVVIGEFGVYRDAADPADRRRWLDAVARAAEAACLGWTHWESFEGFGFVDPRTGAFERDVLDALIPAKKGE